MNWRFKRQLVIFLIIIGILILGGVFLFNSGGQANCFDGRKNGDETGVDCGGSCQLACAAEAKPLLVRFSRPFQAAPGVYNAVSYVENPNPKEAIYKIDYEFRLYDNSDILIAERNGSTYIPPNQRIAIFETDIRTFQRVPTRADFQFLNDPQWITINQAAINLPVTVNDEKIFSVDGSPKLSAIVRNDSLYILNDLTVAAILYDDSGNAVAASKTLIESIGPKENQSLLFSWNSPFEKEPVRIEIIPQIDVFSLSL